jgi:hypothetical protein
MPAFDGKNHERDVQCDYAAYARNAPRKARTPRENDGGTFQCAQDGQGRLGPLYAVLSADQKKVADTLMIGPMGMM